MTMLRVMSKSMFEVVMDHIISICYNWEVKSIAFPLIEDRKSPKEMVFYWCFRP